MKKIGILVSYEPTYRSPTIALRRAYKSMKDVFAKHNLACVRISINDYDAHHTCFTRWIDFASDGAEIQCSGSYKPNIIFNRTSAGNLYSSKILSGYMMVPSFEIVALAKDKYESSLFLRDLQPKTFWLYDFFRHYSSLSSAISQHIVLKPMYGNRGQGIQFMTQQELIDKKEQYNEIAKLYIVQEFKDFSPGYTNLIQGVHDVRIVYIGGKFSFCTIRYAEPREYRCNSALGGKTIKLPMNQVPKKLFEITDHLIQKNSISPSNIFSIDFAYCADERRRYVLELNSFPGITTTTNQQTYFTDLAVLFNSL